MIIKHRLYHTFRSRITKLIILIGLVVYVVIGIRLGKPIDWFADRFILLALAYGFRRAIQ